MVILGDGPVALAFLSCAKPMGIEIYVLGNHRDKLETAENWEQQAHFLTKTKKKKKKASDLFDRKSDICIDTIDQIRQSRSVWTILKRQDNCCIWLKSGENLNVPLPELRNFNIQYVQWPVPEVEAEASRFVMRLWMGK